MDERMDMWNVFWIAVIIGVILCLGFFIWGQFKHAAEQCPNCSIESKLENFCLSKNQTYYGQDIGWEIGFRFDCLEDMPDNTYIMHRYTFLDWKIIRLDKE